MKHRPRKRFGQNFLTDAGVVASIVSAISPAAEDELVEIGPGKGAMTASLAASGAKLTAIEIDRDLATRLRADFPDINLLNQDVLKMDFAELFAGLSTDKKSVRIVGNLPYNISTPLLFRLFAVADALTDMHFMLQLEVVDRMTASPGTKDYGRLSVMTGFYCQAEKLFEVPPSAFTPAPRVTSALVRLTPKRDRPAVKESLLGEIVSHAFSLRRKTLRNSLGKYLDEARLAAIGIDASLRPENLSLEDFVRCAKEAAQ
ncbi:MAG: 16S rRNA (adenine(1518)-N(6)/adenine(1519)-N(6))-dimethyltransferase RsmA [Pseudomonadales bacterium]